jgi:hypothetical protein
MRTTHMASMAGTLLVSLFMHVSALRMKLRLQPSCQAAVLTATVVQ